MTNAWEPEAFAAAAGLPIPADLQAQLDHRLQQLLPQTADAQLVAQRLQPFIAASRSPTSLLAFLQRDEASLPTLLSLLAIGQRVADQLLSAPESLDLIRLSEGAAVGRDVLAAEITAELAAVIRPHDRDPVDDNNSGSDENENDRATAAAAELLTSLVGRERLRIAYAQWSTRNAGPTATEAASEQLTTLADAVVQAAWSQVAERLSRRHGWPQTAPGRRARVALLGLGSWAAAELSYDAPLCGFFLYELSGPSDGAESLPADEFFTRLASGVAQLLSPAQPTPLARPVASPTSRSGEVSWSLNRPAAAEPPLVLTPTQAHRHFQLSGRTWERLLLVKSRTIVGDQPFGEAFLTDLQPWIYRRYFRQEDYDGLRTAARKLVRQASRAAEGDGLDISQAACAAAIDQLETAVATLQVLHGGTDSTVRVASTTEALQRLLASGYLTVADAAELTDHVRFLRHCLQAMELAEITSLDQAPPAVAAAAAWHLGFIAAGDHSAHRDAGPGVTSHGDTSHGDSEQSDAGHGDSSRGQATSWARAIAASITRLSQLLPRLLRDSLGDWQPADAAAELVLDPDPDPDPSLVAEVLAADGLAAEPEVLADLRRLATEPVPYLSHRRTRHHLAAIAAGLLREIGTTPDPHQTLRRLADVSDSLGGKAGLWELFRVMPQTMSLFVRMGGGSPYLCRLLVQNPGMVDELIDSLERDRLPTPAWLESTSRTLCPPTAAATVNELGVDQVTILQGFKNAAHLQIGVRDCLGKDTLEATQAALTATAETVLRRSWDEHQQRLADQFGDPATAEGQPVEGVLLALGSLAACQTNYRSCLSLALLHTAAGQTRRRAGGPRTTVPIADFFSEAAVGMAETVGGQPASGQLYRLRWPAIASTPRQRPGTVADGRPRSLLLDTAAAHFLRGQASLAQRLMLCQARPISGSDALRQRVRQSIIQWLTAAAWFPAFAEPIRQMRRSAEADAASGDLKRAAGGSCDVELLTQMLQLRYGRQAPHILVAGTIDALQQIAAAGLMEPDEAAALQANYRLLCQVESKLCLLDLPQRHSLPSDRASLEQLAYLMQSADADSIVADCRQAAADNRRRFDHWIDRLSDGG